MKKTLSLILVAVAMFLALVPGQAPAGALTQNERWVNRVYNEFLYRNPSAGELAWQTALLSGGTSRSSIVNGLLTSNDFGAIMGVAIYGHFVSRTPTGPEASAVTTSITAGDYDDALLDVMSSATYYSHSGSTSTGFVTSIYTDLLDRSPDAPGLAYWTNQLDTAAKTRRQVASTFLHGSESVGLQVRGRTSATSCATTTLTALSDLFNGAYCILLDRMADSTGATFWIGQLQSSTDHVLTLMVSFTSSSEYYNNS